MEKLTRRVGTPLPIPTGPRTFKLATPYTRILDEQGELIWYDSSYCEHCKTTIVTEEAPYQFCSKCGCYTTVYVRVYDLKEDDYLTLCQDCLKLRISRTA